MFYEGRKVTFTPNSRKVALWIHRCVSLLLIGLHMYQPIKLKISSVENDTHYLLYNLAQGNLTVLRILTLDYSWAKSYDSKFYNKALNISCNLLNSLLKVKNKIPSYIDVLSRCGKV